MDLSGEKPPEPEEGFDIPHESAKPALEDPEVREVHLILDNSALTRGFGNVKRWFNEEYIRTQLKTSAASPGVKIHLSIYLPSYTLHELEYLRKGNTAMASNAREALKFIDEIFDSEDSQDSLQGNYIENFETAPVSTATAKSENPLRYNVYIENRSDQFPTWDRCMSFKLYNLQVKDFPYRQTKLARNVIGGQLFGNSDLTGPHEENPEDPVQTPDRLKHLIRSCVFKRHIEQGSQNMPPLEQWKLVTEDNVTRVWANSFGIDCLNVNEAELLLFLKKDVTSFERKALGEDFNAEHDVFDQPEKGILHRRIDTTSYQYEQLEGLKVNKKSGEGSLNAEKQKTKTGGKKLKNISPPPAVLAQDGVKKEDFDMINYAPRGKGKLWTPKGTTSKKSRKRNTS